MPRYKHLLGGITDPTAQDKFNWLDYQDYGNKMITTCGKSFEKATDVNESGKLV